MSDLNDDVVARQVELLNKHGVNATIAISPENFTYLTGFSVPSQEPLRWRHAAVVLTADGDQSVLCVDMEETTVRDRLPSTDVHVWQEFADNAMQELANLLSSVGAAAGRVAIETDYIPARDLHQLQEQLPRVEFVPGQQVLDHARKRKTPREIDLLRSLSRRTDQAIQRGFEQVGPGDTELDLSGAVIHALYEQGIERQRGMVTASGPRSQYPNVGPTTRKLSAGDVIRFEIFGVSDGYHAGVCRTGVIGEPSAEVSRVWQTLVECRDLVLDMLKPGESAAQVYNKYVEQFSVLGYNPISFVGHGIGVYLHEEPYLGTHGNDTLEEGMVLGIEPLLYLPNHFGAQIKDMVQVTSDGCTVLSDVMDANLLHQIG